MNCFNDQTKKTSEPWKISFWERIKIIKEKNSKKKVVYIYEEADTSTFRYRIYNMCQALSYSNSWSGSYFFQDELDLLKEYIGGVDIFVFGRTRWSLEIDKFLQYVKRNSIPTLFDIDDLVFDIEKLPLVMNTLNIDLTHPNCYTHWFSYSSRLWLMGKLCDATIGTNDYICQRLKNTFGKISFTVNNFLNNEQIIVSDKIYKDKIGKAQENKFVIGYFSGTPSHVNDFKIIASEIRNLLEQHSNFSLEVVGFMEFPDFLQPYINNKQIVHSPLVDFLMLQRKISEANINVIPLIDNEFTNCKSELKFFEAAIVGTVSCATPTYVYKNNIQHGQTGFICEEGDWQKTIEKIYTEKIDSKVIEDARRYCLEKYAPEKQMPSIENMLNTVLGRFKKNDATRMKYKESKLAHKLLDGLIGVEIGGSAHNSFGLNTKNVDYSPSTKTIYKLEEEKLCGECMPVDIIAFGDHLPFPDNSQDFVINSHVLEHFVDPIKALKEWYRVTKDGGYIYMIVPHKDRMYDKDKERTTLQELIGRHEGRIKIEENFEKHHSVWITDDLMELVKYLGWKVVYHQDVDDKVGNGFTVVIQKEESRLIP
jgi:SAM-dependent methyltransferase/glycosyltransferase involved in cell wall biosynthesis